MGRWLTAVACCLISPLAGAALLDTAAGKIEGDSLEAVDRYLGVPYAAPPIDDLRWRGPRPHVPWVGVRGAHDYGSACSQRGNFFASEDASTFDQPYGSEDCLFLNVWAPRAAAGGRPVLVFFHGGSGIFGDSAHPIYDGERLARDADAVVITANYRLGVFGSLQSPALHTGDLAEDSGSFFLLDMIAVLDWARAHCPVLGCDPAKLTISGQSAGAVAVLALLRSPLAQGKFQRAISFSGLPFSASQDTARERTQGLLSALLMADGKAQDETAALDWLASHDEEQLREYLYGQSRQALIAASGRGLSPAYVADGHVLINLDKPDKPAPIVVSQVPLLIGKTNDEMTTLAGFKGLGEGMAAIWPLVNGEPRRETISQTLGMFGGVLRNLKVSIADWFVRGRLGRVEDRYAEQLPAVFVYRFAWANYPNPWRADFGSFHALDLPFIFGNFIDDRPTYMRFAWTAQNRAEREALRREIIASLRGFLHAGDPNGRAANRGEIWRAWDDQAYTRVWGE